MYSYFVKTFYNVKKKKKEEVKTLPYSILNFFFNYTLNDLAFEVMLSSVNSPVRKLPLSRT